MMFQTRLWAAALIIAVVIIGGFALSVPRTRDLGEAELPAPSATSTTPVSVTETFKKCGHTLSGSVVAPDACTSVSVEATVDDTSSTTPRIHLELSMPEDSGPCLEVPTEVSFRATVEAPPEAELEVRVNGVV